MTEKMRVGLINGGPSQDWHKTLGPALDSLGLFEFVEQPIPLERLDQLEAVMVDAAILAELMIERDELRQRMFRIEQQLQVKNDLLGITVIGGIWEHKIEGHAATIKSAAEAIRSGPAWAGLPAKEQGMLNQIIATAESIAECAHTLPLLNDDGDSSISLRDFLTTRLDVWRNDVPAYKGIEFKSSISADDPLWLRIRREYLRELCDQPVDNAVKAMAGSPRRELLIKARRNGDWAEVTFSDTGHGIPKELQDKIFKTMPPKKGSKRGVSFGLVLAQTIVERSDGKIDVVATGPKGTTIFLQLPLAA